MKLSVGYANKSVKAAGGGAVFSIPSNLESR